MKDVRIIPAWAATAMASVSEVAYGFLFFGSKSPELNRQVVNCCTCNYTYNIDKARHILGYNSVQHTEETIKKATEWELEHRSKTEAKNGLR